MCTHTKTSTKHFWAGLFLGTFLAFPIMLHSQTASSSPPSNGDNGYEVNSSVELGVRGLDVNGDHQKFRSDLNYSAGFKLFNSSVLIKDKSERIKPFDEALIQADGWGSEPVSSFRMNLDRTGAYKFDAAIRRVKYFNDLKNYAVAWSRLIPNRSEHRANTEHHFGDLDLTIFPERDDLRLRLGYSFNNSDGPGAYTIRFPAFSGPGLSLRGDEFEVNSVFKLRSDDFRAGVEGKLFGFNFGLNFGHRQFRDNTRFFIDTFNLGNDPGATNATVNSYTRGYPTKGTTDFIHGYFQRTFDRIFDMTGRLIYSETNSKFLEEDRGVGTSSQSGAAYPRVLIDLDQVRVDGDARRPQTRGDLGVTYRVTDSFRISNTFTFDQFNVGGGNRFFEYIISRTTAGGTRPDAASNTSSWRAAAYRRFSNAIEADYQASRWFGFHFGYRITQRKVHIHALDLNLITGATTLTDDEEFDNTTNTIFAGVRIKPRSNWSIYVDADRGQADSVFTRLANNDFFNFRVRSIAKVRDFSLNLSAATRDNDSPGVTSPTSGAPNVEAIANSKIRFFSGSIDWAPRPDLAFSGGYTYNYQNSAVDIVVPVGSPIVPSTQFRLGRSEYFVRDSFFFFDLTIRPVKRVTFYASYRLSDDQGQGDRMVTRPEDMISSYPLRFHMPEARLSFRITRNVDANLGYQYYAYRETPLFIPFNPTTVFQAQNYTANVAYASVKVYFGRSADR